MPRRSAWSTRPGPAPPPQPARPRPRRSTEAAAPARTMPMRRRPGPGPAGRQRARRRRGRAAAAAPRGTERRAGRLVDAVVRRLGHERVGSARPATSRPMRPRLKTTSASGERLGEHAAGLGRGQVALGDDDDEGQLLAERERRVDGAALHRGGGDEAAEHAGRRVLGVPVVGGRHGEGVLGAGGRGGRGGEGGRGAQPPGDGDLRAHRHGEAVVAEDLGRHAGREVRRVVEEAGPLPLAVHAERRARPRSRRSRSSSSATASVSNPGPRLADDAGARARTASG